LLEVRYTLHIFVCVHVHVSVYECMYVYSSVSRDTHEAVAGGGKIDDSTFLKGMMYPCMRVYVYVYACMLHVCACMCMCMHVCLLLNTYPHSRGRCWSCDRRCMLVNAFMYVCVCVCVCVRIFIYIYMYVCMYVCIHIYVYIYTYICMHMGSSTSRGR
jgi:hypothetical protein